MWHVTPYTLIPGKLSVADLAVLNLYIMFADDKIDLESEFKATAPTAMTPFFSAPGLLYKIIFSNEELYIILKRRNLEIGENSSFCQLSNSNNFKGTLNISFYWYWLEMVKNLNASQWPRKWPRNAKVDLNKINN